MEHKNGTTPLEVISFFLQPLDQMEPFTSEVMIIIYTLSTLTEHRNGTTPLEII